MPSETPISLKKDENLPKNTNNEVKGSKKNIKKKRKNKFKKKWNSEYIWEFWRIPREGEYMKSLRRLLTYEDPLYYVATNAFWKKKKSIKSCGWIWKITKNR